MQLFSNNASTTLAASLTSSATTLTVASAAGFVAITWPDFELATIDDGTSREIVKVTARSGTTWTIVRAREGTTAQGWTAGTAIEARPTAGTLAEMMQRTAVPDLLGFNHGGNARGAGAINLQASRGSNDRVASGADALGVGNNTRAAGSRSTALGCDADARESGSLALGANCLAEEGQATAIGFFSKARGYGSLALCSGLAYGDGSVSCGAAAFADSSLVFAGYPTIPTDDWNDQYESYSAGARAAFATPYVDLGLVPDWMGEETYEHGDCIKPSDGGGVQYRVWADYDGNGNPIHELPISTEERPIWPGAGDSVDVNLMGTSSWIGIDWAAGYETEAIPDWLTFFPVEILFVCHKYTASTGLPTISIGTPGNPTLLLDAEPVTITAAGQSFRFPIPNPAPAIAAGESVLIKIVESATAGKIMGRFLLSGFFVEGPARY